MQRRIMNTLLTTTLATATLAPGLALAHVGHDHSFGLGSGFGHPFSGLDHLLAMLAVGFATARMNRHLLTLPLAFIACMILGGVLGFSGIELPLVETGIALSVLVLGLVMLATRLPLAAGLALTGLFALFHGHAHGTEMPEGSTALLYFAGFVTGTLLLHLSGYAMGRLVKQHAPQWLPNAAGASVAGMGALMLSGIV